MEKNFKKDILDKLLVENDLTEVELEKAREVDPTAQLGDLVMVDSTPADFGRVAAQQARQVIQQKIREAENKEQIDHYEKQLGDIIIEKYLKHPSYLKVDGKPVLMLLAAPWLVPEYWLAQLTFVLIYGVIGLGLMLLAGYTGQFSMGHAAFVGVGVYAQAVLTNHGMPFPLAMIMSAASRAARASMPVPM